MSTLAKLGEQYRHLSLPPKQGHVSDDVEEVNAQTEANKAQLCPLALKERKKKKAKKKRKHKPLGFAKTDGVCTNLSGFKVLKAFYKDIKKRRGEDDYIKFRLPIQLSGINI